MYRTLKNGEIKYIWNDKEDIIYQVERDTVQRLKMGIQMLSKFCPELEEIDRSKTPPKSIMDLVGNLT